MNHGGARSFIEKLHNALPESIYPWVIASLRQDPAVWEKLGEPAFHQNVLSLELSVWTSLSPAHLSLLAIAEEMPNLKIAGDHLLINKLHGEIQYPVPPALRKRAVIEYESTGKGKSEKVGDPSSDSPYCSPLAKAGLLALALRERRRMLGSWDGIREELNLQAHRAGMPVLATWRTPLACLYGMIPDASQMLLSLISPGAAQEYFQMAAHVLLSNPLSPEKFSEEVQSLVEKLSLSEVVPLLKELSPHHPALVTDLAGKMGPRSKDLFGKSSPAQSNLHSPPLEQLAALSKMLLLSDAQRLSKNSPASLATLEQAWHSLQYLEAAFAAELALSASAIGDKAQAVKYWGKAENLVPHSPLYRSRLAMACLEAGQVDKAQALLAQENARLDPGKVDAPEFLVAALASAHLAIQSGNLEAAREALIGAIQPVLSRDQATPFGIGQLKTIHELAELLLELGLPVEATHVFQAIVRQKPNDPDLLKSLGQAQHAAGQDQKAVESLQIAVSLAPRDKDLRRQYARLLEAAGDWYPALAEWTSLIGGSAFQGSGAPPLPQDLCAYARCALKAGEPESAAEASRKVLAMEYNKQNPENFALAHLLLGQALQQRGDVLIAQEQFYKATQLFPHRPDAWLALAEAQAATGQSQIAFETLQTGRLAAPDAPEIYLALGNAYLSDWENHGHPSPTQALDMFEKAADLIAHGGGFKRYPDYAPQVYLRLGETLYELGHVEESRKVMELAYQANPSFPGTAKLFSKTLLDLKDQRGAIPVLAQLTRLDENNISAHMNYADALLSVREKPLEAIKSLRWVLELSPGHIQAQALLAEALSANNELDDALRIYQVVLETDLVKDPAWGSRISLGLGRTALALRQPEIAIAALREASRADPDNSQIPCTLAEAYYAAGLLEDALQSARVGLGLGLEDLDVLIWFAEKAITWISTSREVKNGFSPDMISGELASQVRIEALNTLTRALQLAPQRTDLLIRLGKIQLMIEDDQAAAESFQKVLSAQDSSIDDLYEAAEYLLTFGKPHSAVECLEKSITQSGYTRGEAFGIIEHTRLPRSLVKAYQRAGNPQAALSILDQGILHYPMDVSLSSAKANILLDLGRPTEALTALEDTLQRQPEGQSSADLHKQAAYILRSTGDLSAALAHIERILASPGFSAPGPHQVWAHILAAEISRAQLQPEKALAYLNFPPMLDGEYEAFSVQDQRDYLGYFLLDADLALDRGDAKSAEKSFSVVKKSARIPDLTPYQRSRFLAIETRLNSIHGDHDLARRSFQETANYLDAFQQNNDAQVISSIDYENHLDYHAIGAAFLELCQWDSAINLLDEAVEKFSLEPLSHLDLARALVVQAENRRFHVELEGFNHAPPLPATGELTWQRFDQAIDNAEDLVRKWADPAPPAGLHNADLSIAAAAQIARWRGRGLLAFHPDRNSAERFYNLPTTASDPDDIAALIAAIRHTGAQEIEVGGSMTLSTADLMAKVTQNARNFPQHPLVLCQLALSLYTDETHLDEAHQAASEALVYKFGKVNQAQSNQPICPHPLYPLFNILAGRISFLAGDLSRSLATVQAAISCWPDEPRWHTLAASIYRSIGDLSSSIIHLEQAVELEPEYMPHYLKLGESYLHQAQSVMPGGAIEASMNAIQILGKACELSTTEAEPWLSLARAHICAAQENSLEQAAACAERAINLKPDGTEPLVLRAEIALRAGDFQEAYDRALVASRLEELSRIQGESSTPAPQTNPYPILLLVRALDGLGRTGDAIAAIDKALPHVWERLPLLLERLKFLTRAQDTDALLGSLQELAQEYPDEPIVLAPLAKSLADSGDADNAVRIAQKALQVSKSYIQADESSFLDVATQAELHYLLGKLLRETGQLDQAIHHLNEAVRRAPLSLDPYLELGRAYQDRRQHIQALQVYNQVIETSPDRPEPYYYAGLALKESKDYLGAEHMLRRAADLAPKDLTIHRQLGAVVALNLVHNRHKKPMEA